MMIDQTGDGTHIDLPVGQIVEIRLKENPTTGYRWSVGPLTGQACLIVSDRFQLGGAAPGGESEHIWQVRAVQPGACDFEARSVRGFDTPASVGARFSLHLHVPAAAGEDHLPG